MGVEENSPTPKSYKSYSLRKATAIAVRLSFNEYVINEPP